MERALRLVHDELQKVEPNLRAQRVVNGILTLLFAGTTINPYCLPVDWSRDDCLRAAAVIEQHKAFLQAQSPSKTGLLRAATAVLDSFIKA